MSAGPFVHLRRLNSGFKPTALAQDSGSPEKSNDAVSSENLPSFRFYPTSALITMKCAEWRKQKEGKHVECGGSSGRACSEGHYLSSEKKIACNEETDKAATYAELKRKHSGTAGKFSEEQLQVSSKL